MRDQASGGCLPLVVETLLSLAVILGLGWAVLRWRFGIQ